MDVGRAEIHGLLEQGFCLCRHRIIIADLTQIAYALAMAVFKPYAEIAMAKRKKWAWIGSTIGILLTIIFGLPALIDFYQNREPVDVSGNWKFIFHVSESSYQPYVGTDSGYKIFLKQKDQEIEGVGESWEFESDLNFDSHRPISFDGKIEGRNIHATYTLTGKERTTYGSIDLKVSKDGNSMEGEFLGTGADVNGILSVKRL